MLNIGAGSFCNSSMTPKSNAGIFSAVASYGKTAITSSSNDRHCLYWGEQKDEEQRRCWHDVGWGMLWGLSRMWTSSICKMTGTSGPGRGFLSTCHQQTPLCNVHSPGVTAGAGTAQGTPALTLRSLHLVASHLLLQANIQASNLAAYEK